MGLHGAVFTVPDLLPRWRRGHACQFGRHLPGLRGTGSRTQLNRTPGVTDVFAGMQLG